MNHHATDGNAGARSDLAARYADIRAQTEARVSLLSPEDQQVQSMPDASPVKWHRAHTSWFFEQFILLPGLPGYRPFDAAYGYLFNSYYVAAGSRQARPGRGLMTRPSCQEITAYRAHVDQAMLRLIPLADARTLDLIVLGLQHEQQHQELIWTDCLHLFAQNPTSPAMLAAPPEERQGGGSDAFLIFDGGITRVGAGPAGFCFDNELPRHKSLLAPFGLSRGLVTNAEFAAFIDDGGYRTASLWMAEGFDLCSMQGWSEPLHWRPEQMEMTLAGLRPRDPAAPVRHISWYEADAFARWAGARLPSEQEWEHAAQAGSTLAGMFGAVWQWTASAYLPYPGFRPAAGAVGEYNGKFMINQMVLRGSSLATPPGHARASYRNFFHPHQRWQFSGLRLAKDGQ